MAIYNLTLIRPNGRVSSSELVKLGFTVSYWEKEKRTLMKTNDVLTYKSQIVSGKVVVTAISILFKDGYVEVLVLDKNSIK